MPQLKFFDRSSPALQEIFLKLHRAEHSVALDHNWFEFGCVEYHVQSSDTKIAHLSISTPVLCNGLVFTNELLCCTKAMKKAFSSNLVEIIEPAREGYQLTLKLDLAKLPRGKAKPMKMITEISSVQSTIVSSQLKEILTRADSEDSPKEICRPIKITYHPGEPFFIIKQPAKITTVFPLRFKEETDVAIATAFFQELVEVRNLKKYARAPTCTWSPIPPAELRGEHLQDLSTNGGFITFEMSPRQLEGKRLDKTAWCLLNFYAFVKHHVKGTKGFIMRRMRSRLENLAKVLKNDNIEQDQDEQIRDQGLGCGCMENFINIPKSPKIRSGCGFGNIIKRNNSKIKIRWFSRFRRRWLSIPKFSSTMKYRKLE